MLHWLKAGLSREAHCWSLPLGKTLVSRIRAENQHHRQSGVKSSPLSQDNNIYTEQMPVPIRRKNIHQTTLKLIFYSRSNIYLFFFFKEKKKAMFTTWVEGWMKSNDP